MSDKKEEKQLKRQEKKLEKKEKRIEKKEEKREKQVVLKEARKVLLNYVELDSDGHFVVTEGVRFQLWGAADGESKIRIWGISSRDYIFVANQNNNKAIYKVSKAINSIGRGINMKCKPNIASCLIKTYVFYPVVLAFYENDDGRLQLSAYTARCLTAPIAIKIATRRFEKAVSGITARLGKESSEFSESVKNVTGRIKQSRRRRNSDYIDGEDAEPIYNENRDNLYSEYYDNEEMK